MHGDAERRRWPLVVRIAAGAVMLSLLGAAVALVSSATAPRSGRLAVVAVGFSYPQPTPRIALYAAGGRPLVTLASGRPFPMRVGLSDPAWSPDGRSLLFTRSGPERSGASFTYYDQDVYAIDVSTHRITRLTTTRDALHAVPSPDGAAIAFARTEAPGKRPFTTGMWLMRSDGGGRRRLLPTRRGWQDLPGSWSPDGRRLAFTRCSPELFPPDGLFSDSCTIYELDLGTRKLHKLAGRARSPAFSPDGSSLAFVSDREENGTVAAGSDENAYAHELYVAAADGTGARRLTETEGVDEQTPTWSPDSRSIAYAREGPASFKSEVAVLDLENPNPTIIAGHAASGGRPRGWAWSVDQPAWRP